MKASYLFAIAGLGVLLLFFGCTQSEKPSGLAGLISAEPAACTDSDNGKDIYTLGYVNGTCADCAGNGTGSNTDTCVTSLNGIVSAAQNSSQLMEFYCTPSGWAREIVSCQKGCQNGACLQ